MSCTLILFATAVLLLSDEISALGQCQKEVAKFDRRMLGAFIPRCKPDGSYEEKQCHGSTGHCWCVQPSTGKEILGSRKGPGKGVTICADCTSPTKVGRCRALLWKWNYSPLTRRCNRFAYGGCGGNTNNYKSRSVCMKTCGGRRPVIGRPKPIVQCRCVPRLACLDGQKLLVTPASKTAICPCPTYRCVGAPSKSVKCLCPKIRCADARTVPNGTYKRNGCTCTKYKCVGYRLSCLHNKKRYSVGQSFKSPKGCGGSCTCTRRGFGYASFVCLHRPCMPTGISKAGYCLHKGRKYLKGQRITIRCNSCFCAVGRGRRVGSFACTKRSCARPLGYCLHKGRKYLKGQRIMFGCNSCFCAVGRGRRVGRFACTMMGCPRPRTSIRKKGCVRTCRRNYRPVCGSDGKSYSNLCTFLIARCKSNGKLSFRYGKCKADCTSPKQVGRCRGLFWKWNYNPVSDACNRFAFGGCGGNGNRYNSRSECMRMCSRKRKLIRRMSGYGGNWRWSFSVQEEWE